MDETRAVAHLPTMTIELAHRRAPDGNAEYLSIDIAAAPSFAAFARLLEFNPWTAWQQMMLAPWLALMGASAPERQMAAPSSRSSLSLVSNPPSPE